MTAADKPTAAFILSLVGGVLILSGALLGFVRWVVWGGMMWSWNGWGGMMCPGCGMMGWWTPWAWTAFSSLGLVSGILVTVGALMLQTRPQQANTWGSIILAFSAISLISMGGFVVGALLGIIGGILAIAWKTA
ncbi:MAG: DUF6114 domain-containing protein [Candidatus Caldarchaeum sp.]